MNTKQVSGYWTAMLAVAIGWTVFAWPWLSSEVTIPYDAKAHFQPQLQFLARALHSGQSPFWTHNVFAGSPQIADPQSLIFSPAFLLAYFDPAPSFRELDIFCFALLGLAAFSVLMFFKDRGWHPAGAAVAALATAFGGSSIWRIQHVKQIESFAFSILCLWLLARALDRKSVFYGLLAGLAASVMIIEPGQVAMLACYVLAAYTVDHVLAAPRPWIAVRQVLAPLLSGTLLAGILAVGPVILSFLFVQDSNRPEIPFKDAARGALHPASLLTAIVPDLYSVHSNLPYWGPASSDWMADWLNVSENMGQIYIGALPVLLILAIGIMRGRIWMREIRVFSLAALVLLLYALGRYTPAFRIFYDLVPGVDLFRRPADATYALGAIASILSGYLLHRLLSGEDTPTPRQRYIVLGCLAAMFLASIGVAIAHDRFYWAIKPVLLSVGLFTAGWLLLLFARLYVRRYAALTIAGLAAFVTLDLAINNGPSRSTAKPPSDFDELRVDTRNETIIFLKTHINKEGGNRRDRVELVGLGFEWPNVSLIHNFDHVLGYNPLRLGEIVKAMGATETIANARQRQFTPLFPSYRSTLADLLGLRYIAINQPIENIDKHLKPGDLTLAADTSEGYIYENPRAFPRVHFAFNWMPADFDRMIQDGQWPAFDPKRTVLLQKASTPPLGLRELPVSLSSAKVELAIYENTKVQILVDSPEPGFVVLNDIWHPWWFATVDEKPADVLRANVLFRAVQVPAGKHVVRFEFRPIEGATREIKARLSGKPLEPGLAAPGDYHARPEASAQILRQPTLEAIGILR